MGSVRARCVVFDFDGTLTDADALAEVFESNLRAQLSEALDAPIDEVWSAVGATVEIASGWEIDGRIVAPALGDPYLRATWIARRVAPLVAPALDAPARRDLVSRAYASAYARAPARFRSEAEAVVRAALARVDRVFVVSNSPAASVRAKLASIGLDAGSGVEVVGDARKFDVTEDTSPSVERAAFDALPIERAIEGLPRPIYLRRGRYFAALDHAARAARCGLDAMLVCGDIFELDLALPAALGAAVHLVTRRSTLDHERAEALRLPRGSADEELDAVLDRLPSI